MKMKLASKVGAEEGGSGRGLMTMMRGDKRAVWRRCYPIEWQEGEAVMRSGCLRSCHRGGSVGLARLIVGVGGDLGRRRWQW